MAIYPPPIDEIQIVDAIYDGSISLTRILLGIAEELPDNSHSYIAGFGDNLRDETADANPRVQANVKAVVRELFVQLGRPGERWADKKSPASPGDAS